MATFGTVLVCMDGRAQRKVADYLTTSFGVRHLDTITTAGVVRHLSEETQHTPILLANLELSRDAHGSNQIGVVAHHDCAGNPIPDRAQKDQLAGAMSLLKDLHPDADVVGLWLNEHWIVERAWPW